MLDRFPASWWIDGARRGFCPRNERKNTEKKVRYGARFNRKIGVASKLDPLLEIAANLISQTNPSVFFRTFRGQSLRSPMSLMTQLPDTEADYDDPDDERSHQGGTFVGDRHP